MYKNVLGVINLGEKEDNINEITVHRPIATIPFAGRYRLIDFILSSMTNSGIDTISIVLKNKFHSINDHIGPGKYWDLDRKTGGLRLLYPSIDYDKFTTLVGDISVFNENISYFHERKQDQILFARSNYLGNINFSDAIEDHLESSRDITILTRSIKNGSSRLDLLGYDMVVNKDGNITIGRNLGNQENFEISVEMYLIKKEVFIDIIKTSIESGSEAYFKQAFLKRLKDYEVGTYGLDVDIFPVGSIQSYFNASMNLLNPEYAKYLFFKNGKIVTKIKDEPSTIYKKGAKVKNSLVANGCIIEGNVENSIIFRGAIIKKGTNIRNSIIFQDVTVGENSNINYCILDKDVVVNNNKTLIGDTGVPYIVKKGVIIK